MAKAVEICVGLWMQNIISHRVHQEKISQNKHGGTWWYMVVHGGTWWYMVVHGGTGKVGVLKLDHICSPYLITKKIQEASKFWPIFYTNLKKLRPSETGALCHNDLGVSEWLGLVMSFRMGMWAKKADERLAVYRSNQKTSLKSMGIVKIYIYISKSNCCWILRSEVVWKLGGVSGSCQIQANNQITALQLIKTCQTYRHSQGRFRSNPGFLLWNPCILWII